MVNYMGEVRVKVKLTCTNGCLVPNPAHPDVAVNKLKCLAAD